MDRAFSALFGLCLVVLIAVGTLVCDAWRADVRTPCAHRETHKAENQRFDMFFASLSNAR